MRKTIVEPGRPQMTIWRMRIACRITKLLHTNTHTHTLKISSTYCFSTETVFERKLLNVTTIRTFSAWLIIYTSVSLMLCFISWCPISEFSILCLCVSYCMPLPLHISEFLYCVSLSLTLYQSLYLPVSLIIYISGFNTLCQY